MGPIAHRKCDQFFLKQKPPGEPGHYDPCAEFVVSADMPARAAPASATAPSRPRNNRLHRAFSDAAMGMTICSLIPY